VYALYNNILQCYNSPITPVKVVKALVCYICAWKNTRLALQKSTAAFKLEFFGAIAIGGKDPNDALAKDVSRALFLKKAARTRVQDRRHKSLDLITHVMTHLIRHLQHTFKMTLNDRMQHFKFIKEKRVTCHLFSP
jgi:hypothetical protein